MSTVLTLRRMPLQNIKLISYIFIGGFQIFPFCSFDLQFHSKLQDNMKSIHNSNLFLEPSLLIKEKRFIIKIYNKIRKTVRIY